jgi:hypothetical protein
VSRSIPVLPAWKGPAASILNKTMTIMTGYIKEVGSFTFVLVDFFGGNAK